MICFFPHLANSWHNTLLGWLGSQCTTLEVADISISQICIWSMEYLALTYVSFSKVVPSEIYLTSQQNLTQRLRALVETSFNKDTWKTEGGNLSFILLGLITYMGRCTWEPASYSPSGQGDCERKVKPSSLAVSQGLDCGIGPPTANSKQQYQWVLP